MYNDLIIEKSWHALQEFKRQYHFILIGGWAVYLYTKSLKSKDIDVICDYDELQKLKEHFELIKNDRLKKYEIHMPEFDIDIYTPFFSHLGVPIEHLQKLTRVISGFNVLAPEALLLTKQHAYRDRQHSLKGEKDKIDIIALLASVVNMGKYSELIKKFHAEYFQNELQALLTMTRSVPELGLNQHAFSQLKKRISLLF